MDDKEKQIKDALDYVSKRKDENQIESELPAAVDQDPLAKENNPEKKAPRKSRRSSPDYVSAEEAIDMGKGMVKSGILGALMLICLNLIVFFVFNQSFRALYIMNVGYFVIRPFFKFFDKFAVEVTDLKTGESWIETKGFWGIIVGLVVLNLGTWMIRSYAEELFPSFAFIHNGIYVAGSLFVSGRYILRNIRNVIFGVKAIKAGKNELKDTSAPSADLEIERMSGVYFRNTIIMIVSSVILCGAAVFFQYVHLWTLAPKLEKELDVFEAYHAYDEALPFSDGVVKSAKGEFLFYSTEYTVGFEEDFDKNGVVAHYKQGLTFKYDYENKKWTVTSSYTEIDVKELNVSGVFTASPVYDRIDEIENASYILAIDSLTKETASGTLTVKNGETIVYTSRFSGEAVLGDGGMVTVTAKLETLRNEFFGIGFDDLKFTYSVADDSVSAIEHYESTLIREAAE